MDGRGRLAQPLNWIARLCGGRTSRMAEASMRRSRRDGIHVWRRPAPDTGRLWQGLWSRLIHLRAPRGVGITAAVVLVVTGAGYGVVRGEHLPNIVAVFKDACDDVGNALGFHIVTLSVTGMHHLSREEVLASAQVTGRTSLLFLDVAAARERLKANPWVAGATVLKLYPGELRIRITERQPFALWQHNRQVTVIAADGTVLQSYVPPQLFTLPLVVGRGAAKQAKDFLALLAGYPELRGQVRASILVARRRWNLKLRNGLDIRLPESDVAHALNQLRDLDRRVQLLSRDIVFVDLRLPDRVTVRLSEPAWEDRLKSIKAKPKRGGRA